MQNLLSTSRSLAALALATAGLLGSALAAPVVSISPASQDLAVGAQTTVDIVVSNLDQNTEAIGGFFITLDFDDSILGGVDFVLDPTGSMGAGEDFLSSFIGASLELAYLADLTLGEDGLGPLQGASFILATVRFEGLANGLSPLTLSAVDLSYADGFTTIPGVTSRDGSICVGGNCTVPEPGTYGLAGVALLAAGWAGRARRRKQAIV